MTRTTNARLAGLMFLFSITIGITSMVVFRQATGGAEGTAETLASLAQHAATVRLSVLLTLLTFFVAVTLAVTLYALTRDQDHDLALLALCCRGTEAVIAPISAVQTLGLLSVATASTAAAAPDAAAGTALGALLLQQGKRARSSPRPALRWAVPCTPTSSCGPKAYPSHWPSWAWSPRCCWW